MTHTPGPWTTFRPLKGKYRGDFAIHPSNGPAFAYLAQGREDMQQANARLIAAAPELLEALKSALMHVPGKFRSVVVQAQKAIAKAEGAEKHDVYLHGQPVPLRAAIAKAEGK